MFALARGALVLAFCAAVATAAAPLSAKTKLFPRASEAPPMEFETIWSDDVGEAGSTIATFNPTLGGDRVGVYPYANGVLEGCYDPKTRVLSGVWTQTGAARACASSVGGRAIWGEFRFEFTEDGRDFKGVWNSCGEGAEYAWNGYLRPTPIQAPDMRDPIKTLEALPRCQSPVS